MARSVSFDFAIGKKSDDSPVVASFNTVAVSATGEFDWAVVGDQVVLSGLGDTFAEQADYYPSRPTFYCGTVKVGDHDGFVFSGRPPNQGL